MLLLDTCRYARRMLQGTEAAPVGSRLHAQRMRNGLLSCGETPALQPSCRNKATVANASLAVLCRADYIRECVIF